MASIQLPLDTAVDAISKAAKEAIERRIAEVIHEHIDPMVRSIAAQKATEICDNARVVMQRSVMDYGDIHLLIQFNGEIFKQGE